MRIMAREMRIQAVRRPDRGIRRSARKAEMNCRTMEIHRMV